MFNTLHVCAFLLSVYLVLPSSDINKIHETYPSSCAYWTAITPPTNHHDLIFYLFYFWFFCLLFVLSNQFLLSLFDLLVFFQRVKGKTAHATLVPRFFTLLLFHIFIFNIYHICTCIEELKINL